MTDNWVLGAGPCVSDRFPEFLAPDDCSSVFSPSAPSHFPAVVQRRSSESDGSWY